MNKKINIKKLIILLGIICLIFIIWQIYKNIITEKYSKLTILYDNEYLDYEISNYEIDEKLNIYLSKEDIMKLFDETLYYNEALKEIITTSDTHIARLVVDSNSADIDDNEVTLNLIPYIKDKKIYLPLNELASVYNIEVKYSNRSNRIIISSLNKEKITSNLIKKAKVYNSKGIFSKVIEKVIIGDQVTILEVNNKWTKIVSPLGNIGYVKTKYLSSNEKIRDDIINDELKSIEYYSKYSNMSGVYSDIMVNNEKFNIISPSFYFIKDEGNVTDRSGINSATYSIYSDWATRNSLNIVPGIKNDGNVSVILNSYQNRKNAINSILNYVISNNYQAINIDFDSIDDVYSFYRFVIETYPRCKKNNIKLIVTKNELIDTNKIQNYVDYIVQN